MPLRRAAPDRRGRARGPGPAVTAAAGDPRSRPTSSPTRGSAPVGRAARCRTARVEVHIGKVELGQGILTALAQVAADALAVPLETLRMVAAHTALGPDEGLTAGSLSVLQAGPALRHVGAVVRALAGPTEPLRVRRRGSRRSTRTPTSPPSPPTPPRARRRVGQRRAPARPARQGARPAALPRRPAPRRACCTAGCCGRRRPAPDSSTSTRGGRRRASTWSATARSSASSASARPTSTAPSSSSPRPRLATSTTPARRGRPAALAAGRPARGDRGARRGDAPLAGATLTASYSKPFLVHASIAPSCGLARWDDDGRCTCGATARASTRCATRSPRALGLDPARSSSSTSRTPAATATTPPTTRPSTPCCWPGRCPAGRCWRAGPAPTS